MRISDKELRRILSTRPGSLTADDLRFLRPDHVEALSLHQVAGLSPSLIAGLKVDQLAALTQEQVSVLSLHQMGLAPEALKTKVFHLAIKQRSRQQLQEHRVMLRQAVLALCYSLLIPFLWLIRKLNIN